MSLTHWNFNAYVRSVFRLFLLAGGTSMTRDVLQHHAVAAARVFLRRAAAINSSHLRPPSLTGASISQQQARTLHYTQCRSLSGSDKASTMNSRDDKDADATAQTAPNTGTPPAAGGIFGNLPARTAAARAGRGCLIALPIVGIGFSAWTCVTDYRRVRHELKRACVGLALAEMSFQREAGRKGDSGSSGGGGGANSATRPTLDASPVRSFSVALVADAGVLGFHLLAAYGLWHGWDPDPIVNAEIGNLVAAVVSTGGGLRGEYLAANRMRQISGRRRTAAEALARGEGGTGASAPSDGGG
ncbi:unnamed protein product [Ectocarpus sp. CCAP 1310/34]|nr:unnamed protein product [Ectocarpus sp. CCAP 1310/34]